MTHLSFSSSSSLSSAPPSPTSSQAEENAPASSKAKGLKAITPELDNKLQLQQEPKPKAQSPAISASNPASPNVNSRDAEGFSTDKKRDLEREMPQDMPAKKRRIAPTAVPKEDILKADMPEPTVRLTNKKRTTKRWQPENVIQNHRSPIAGADIRAILSHPLAWAGLPPSDRSQILAKFPDSQHILNPGTPEAAPNIASLRSDDNFRSDAALFSSLIAAGRLNALWLHDAWTAHERRRAGEFDDFEIETFEEDWGIRLPEEMKGGRRQQQSGTVPREAAASKHWGEGEKKALGKDEAGEKTGGLTACGKDDKCTETREKKKKVMPESTTEDGTSEDELASSLSNSSQPRKGHKRADIVPTAGVLEGIECSKDSGQAQNGSTEKRIKTGVEEVKA